MEPNIRNFPSIAGLTENLVELIAVGLSEKPAGERFSIALSGGSTPKAIFQHIVRFFPGAVDWQRIDFFWGDERCVPPDDPESNYRMTAEHLFRGLAVQDRNIFRIRGEAEPEGEVVRYAALVQDRVTSVRSVPRIDLILLGLGEDGHTASIFPYNIELFDSDNLFMTSRHPVSGQIRITATGKLINHAATVAFLVTGAGKAEKVSQVLQQHNGWENLPASRVQPVDGRLLWLLGLMC